MPPSQQAVNFVTFAFCTLLLVLGLPNFLWQIFELVKAVIQKYKDNNYNFIVRINAELLDKEDCREEGF